MIVSCPACSRRYKIRESKIQGRGAKITCPRCAHRFVVYLEGRGSETLRPTTRDSQAPHNVATLDFRTLGLAWQVRDNEGTVCLTFHDLETLQANLASGHVTLWDELSFNGHDWTEIGSINALDTFFWNVWRRARRAAPASPAPAPPVPEPPEEDESDLPTTIVGRAVTQEIRNGAEPRPPPVLHPPDPSDEGSAHLYAFGFADEVGPSQQARSVRGSDRGDGHRRRSVRGGTLRRGRRRPAPPHSDPTDPGWLRGPPHPALHRRC